MMLSAFRFFFVVARPGDDAVLIGAAVVGFALYLAVLNPTGFEQTLDLAIVFQLFAASTGYRERLRRGHFDPILVGRAGSWRIAAAHWAVSASLGVLVWIVLVLIELTMRPGQWPMGLKAPHLLVLLYTSTAVWVLTLPLPRYTGALLWLVALVALLATQKLQALRLTLHRPETPPRRCHRKRVRAAVPAPHRPGGRERKLLAPTLRPCSSDARRADHSPVRRRARGGSMTPRCPRQRVETFGRHVALNDVTISFDHCPSWASPPNGARYHAAQSRGLAETFSRHGPP